jgi:hypothetical protein
MVMMRYVLAFAIVVALSTASSSAQGWEKPDPAHTSVPPDVTFELIHNPRSAETYRLHKSAGQVWVLKRSPGFASETWAWKPIQPAEEIAARRQSSTYQLFIAPSSTIFLLDVNTGATWMLRTVSGELRWVAVTVDRS